MYVYIYISVGVFCIDDVRSPSKRTFGLSVWAFRQPLVEILVPIDWTQPLASWDRMACQNSPEAKRPSIQPSSPSFISDDSVTKRGPAIWAIPSRLCCSGSPVNVASSLPEIHGADEQQLNNPKTKWFTKTR